MKRTLTRLATLALAAPLSAALAAAPAQAGTTTVTVPGCFGVGDQIVCDVTASVQVPDAAFTAQYVKVCAGACYDVPVTSVTTSGATVVCVSYTRYGSTTPTRTCTSKVLAFDDQVESYLLNALACSDSELICFHA